MPAQTRVTDIGQGHCTARRHGKYTTVFDTGSSSVLTNNLISGVVTTIGHSTCGHPTTAETGSPNVFYENKPAHRIGDTGRNTGPYVVVTGSPNVFINDHIEYGFLPLVPVPIPGSPDQYKELLAPFQPSAQPLQVAQSINEDTPDSEYTPTEQSYLKDAGADPSNPSKASEGKVDIAQTPPPSSSPVDCFSTAAVTPATQLSPNFTLNHMTNTVVSRATLQEVNHSTYGTLTKQQVLCNLQHLCINVIEPLKAKYGNSMALNSILRNGSGGSQHLAGMAVDIQFPHEFNTHSYKTRVYMARVQEIIALVPYDQFILEYGSSGPIFHISYNPKGNRPTGTKFKLATRLSLVNSSGSFVDGIHYLPST